MRRHQTFKSRCDHEPTASEMHFFVKLFFAAPANFLSAAAASQVDLASASHFFMKLVLAAPASFLSPTVAVQDEPSACASGGRAKASMRLTAAASVSGFM